MGNRVLKDSKTEREHSSPVGGGRYARKEELEMYGSCLLEKRTKNGKRGHDPFFAKRKDNTVSKKTSGLSKKT